MKFGTLDAGLDAFPSEFKEDPSEKFSTAIDRRGASHSRRETYVKLLRESAVVFFGVLAAGFLGVFTVNVIWNVSAF
jgi:hypothetical protein